MKNWFYCNFDYSEAILSTSIILPFYSNKNAMISDIRKLLNKVFKEFTNYQQT